MLGRKRIEVNADGQILVIERFIGDEVIFQLGRQASLELATKVFRAQGVEVPAAAKGGAR